MQVILDQDEAWSLMMLATSYVIDKSGVTQPGKQKLRRWRSDRGEGSKEMAELSEGMNKALGAFIDEQTNRQLRNKKGRYERKRGNA
ncbi:MAG: hypothetical protein ABI559_12030 [Chloroflexota bacterium]